MHLGPVEKLLAILEMKRKNGCLPRRKPRFPVYLAFSLPLIVYLFIWRLGEKTSHREDFMFRKLIPPIITYWSLSGTF